MRALTVRQPWAWAIFHGKVVENRSGWKYSYTGPLLIHAGQQLADDGAWRTVEALAGVEMPLFGAPRQPVEAELGAVIGLVHLLTPHWWTDCHKADGSMCSPWAERDRWHLPVRAARPLRRPVPCNGRLGLWHPPREALEDAKEVL